MDISLEKQFGGEGVFANILHDESFKVVVGAPQNERLLIDIIGLLIPGKKISSITLINREQHGLSNWEKNTTFDLICKDDTTKEEFLVEMQFSPMDTYMERMLYYATVPLRLQMAAKPRGKMDYSLSPLYVVSIVNFSLPHESDDALDEEMISRYSITNNNNGEKMTNALNFVYLELGRLKEGFEQREKCDTALKRLAWDMKYAYRLKKRPSEATDEISKRFYKATELAAMNKLQQQKYEKAMRNQFDEFCIKEYARRTGLEEGRAEGLEEGRAEGRAEGAKERSLEIARALIREKVEPAIIASATGLTLEEIRAIS